MAAYRVRGDLYPLHPPGVADGGVKLPVTTLRTDSFTVGDVTEAMLEVLLGDDARSSGAYLAEFVYGANDGIVTTFAVVAGVAGASLSPSIVLVLGAANLFADGFSMGMSNYLSRQSELAYRESQGDDADPDGKSPASTALATFVAFVLAGVMPLVPYAFGIRPLFPAAVAVTGVTFFAVGASRSLVTARGWVRSGAEMFAIGMLAAVVAFVVGDLLAGAA
ncbi:VIT1/CCC1 transporter family protein [Halorussus caseinilyticus]|uniref:VIT1/CCC1 transporter family protein n=1 Tax=Halorussus caseinilyticus TaxID=3034025 RepID=A0ABD5WQG4_9EURY|nr:VIT1/CCC1 transporter family protein [Halorussus sp. DT72]